MNAFGSALEILTLYAQRLIVEKHHRYALYHPSAEALASMLTDVPYKLANSFIFNLTLYFMVNLRRTPDAFFFFWFISLILTFTMSMLFRTIASVSRTLSQAMVSHSGCTEVVAALENSLTLYPLVSRLQQPSLSLLSSSSPALPSRLDICLVGAGG